jgi:hypothetical protein
LGNSFKVVRGMRSLPITRDAVLQLVALTRLPPLPLLISFEELLSRLLKVVF